MEPLEFQASLQFFPYMMTKLVQNHQSPESLSTKKKIDILLMELVIQKYTSFNKT